MKRPLRQTEFVQAHPLIRPMDFYGRYFKVSFGKEGDGNGEFIALRATSGEEKGKSLDGAQALSQAAAYRSSAVQPPATALFSISTGRWLPHPVVQNHRAARSLLIGTPI
jgi:hypothetical protein